MVQISIIIPVYNTSLYLEQCIESILQQEFIDYEIILVNDGSTDSSGSICDLYSQTYKNIKTVHKENGGLSDARNTGLMHSEGEFILFVDSDDYIIKGSLGAIKNTLDENPQVDVIFLEAIKVFLDGKTIPLGDGYQKKEIVNQSHEDVLSHIANLPKFPGSACTKLVKRTLIQSNNLYFEKGQLSEDIDWTIRLLISANTFNFCSTHYYCYRQDRNGSITNTANINNVISLLGIIEKWVTASSNNGLVKNFEKYINAFLAYEYIMVILLYSNLSSIQKKELKRQIESFSWLLAKSNNKKVRYIKWLYKVLGIDLVAYMLSKYLSFR